MWHIISESVGEERINITLKPTTTKKMWAILKSMSSFPDQSNRPTCQYITKRILLVMQDKKYLLKGKKLWDRTSNQLLFVHLQGYIGIKHKINEQNSFEVKYKIVIKLHNQSYQQYIKRCENGIEEHLLFRIPQFSWIW